MEAPDSGKIINIAMLIGLVIVLVVIYKIMASVGLIKTGASKAATKEQATAAESLRTDDYFNPEYYKGKNFQSIGKANAEQYAKDLRFAMGGVGTNEEVIYTTFGSLYNKCNISEIAEQYKDQYGFPFYIMSNNLQNDLLNDLNKSEVATLMELINRLPSA